MTIAVVGFGASATNASALSFPGGPLTVSVGPLGQCQSSYPSSGNNFFPPTGNVGDCGFFLAFPEAGNVVKGGGATGLQNQTYGFNGSAGPFGLDLYKAISQSPVTGAGTEGSPYTETTVFSVNDVEKPETEYALVTETTTYVNGAPQFTSTYNVKNMSASPIYFRAMYAGDLYVNGNDRGTGVFLGGPPRFIGGQNTGSGVLGGFQEVPAPALEWSSFQELPYPNVWTTVQTTVKEPQAFLKGSLEPAEVDNAAGVEWDQLRELGKGLQPTKEQAFTIVNRTQVPSALQFSPVTQTLTQGQTETITATALNTAKEPYAGRSLRYTVSGGNPQSGSVTLNAAGQAQISYVGKNAGIDTIKMYVDLGGTGVQTPSDPAGTAMVTFVPLPDGGYKVQSIKANSDGTITIVFVPTQSGAAILEVTVPTGTIAKKNKKCKKGQVKIKGKCRAATTVSGKVSATGVGGVPLTLSVKPSSKVTSALKKGKTVHLTATLTYKSSLGGKSTAQVFHVTVKGKKAKKKARKH